MMRCQFIDHIHELDATTWNAVAGTDYPFTRFEFLAALELSQAVCRESGWQPHHLLLYRDDRLMAVMPLYLKYHSYGEYVFDWAWADAFHRHGREYYPKLLAAIPFTPATGPRLCIHPHVPDSEQTEIIAHVAAALVEETQRLQLSSCHILFNRADLNPHWQARGFMTRLASQYHWFNQGYTSFDDFLAHFTSRKRKNLNKERQRVREQGLVLETRVGSEISTDDWDAFYAFYQLTYAKRSGHGGYLNRAFFQHIATTMSHHIVLVLAYLATDRARGPIAGALNFRDSQTLYGRYWGCLREYEYLHFEACYYQGIEFCIREGLQRFDPGAQGEHKIQRGFTPIATWSNHWIAEPGFRHAIADFVARETPAMQRYITEAGSLLPFKHRA